MKHAILFLIGILLLMPGTAYAAPASGGPIEALWSALLDWVDEVLTTSGEANDELPPEEEPPVLSHGGYIDPAG